MLTPGTRVIFRYINEEYHGVLTKKIGSPSDPYQWTFLSDEGQDFVVCDDELEVENG